MFRLTGSDYFGKVTGVDGYHYKNIRADRLASLASLGSLQRLQIAVSHTDEETFRAIGDMSNLQILVLSTPPFPTEYLAHFSRLEHLEKVHITQPIGDQGIAYLCRLPNLKTIDLSSKGVTQRGIQQLAALQHLERIKLTGNLEVTDETRRVLGSVVIDDGSWQRAVRHLKVVQTVEP
jgi:Leucine-rich repeat (LRR) protein